ncbi:hypothetical protein K523DRAFT_149510 [Schizophyllum commune Tattone D]|nr:hypothetical protein K523DRAFT_149510 [Schizophyllum commune Tattone D]
MIRLLGVCSLATFIFSVDLRHPPLSDSLCAPPHTCSDSDIPQNHRPPTTCLPLSPLWNRVGTSTVTCRSGCLVARVTPLRATRLRLLSWS